MPEAGIAVSVTVDQEGEVRLSQASMRTGMFALPVRVKANRPAAKRGGVSGLKAGFQETGVRPATGESHPVAPGRW